MSSFIELHGWISEYWEQGMEGFSFLTFQDREFAESREKNWRHEGMYILQEGDELTIFDDGEKIIWTGLIETRRGGFLHLCKISPSDKDWTPQDISLEKWKGWFNYHPPLNAILKRKN